MNFTGNEDHSISLNEAAELTANYRSTLTSNTEAKAEYFGKAALVELLNQSAAVGVRIYYGIDNAGIKKLVLVGVDAEGNDLYEGALMERGQLCPPECSAENPLNS